MRAYRRRRKDASGEGHSAFQRLESQGRLLQRSIFGLVVLVAVVPPLLFSIMEVRELRRRAWVHGQHVAAVLDLYARLPEARPEGLRRHLMVELDHDDVDGIEVLDAEGHQRMTLGRATSRVPLDTVDMPVSAPGSPVARLRVRMRNERLHADLPRLAAIHLLMGLVLGLGVYRVPVRAFARALSELKSAQAQVIHSNRLSALGAMYAGLTHEINNPLGILSARTKLALEAAREKGDQELAHELEVIDQQAGRIAAVMRSLLAFARRTELTLRPLDLNAVVRDVTALVAPPFAKAGIEMRAELDPSLPADNGSPEHLQQVLLNLLTNARDAMPAGGSIEVRTYRQAGRAAAEVRDTGPGLTQQAQARLFEPFFTTKEVGRGTGLGLSISHGILSAHGGGLEGLNAAGGGALFRLWLPASPQAAA